MANTVITFQSDYQQQMPQKKTNTSEVYADVSLLSKYGSQVRHLGKNRILDDANLKLAENDETILNVDANTSLKINYRTSNSESQLVHKIARSVNVKAVQNAIENIFSFFPGERVLYPDFGSRLKIHLYNGITTFNVEQIVSEIYSNMEQFDERVVIDDIAIVSTDEDTDDNTVVLRITYHIDGLSQIHYTYDYSYVTGD